MPDTHMLDSATFSTIAAAILAEHDDDVDPAAETIVDAPCPCLPPPPPFATMSRRGEITPLVSIHDAY